MVACHRLPALSISSETPSSQSKKICSALQYRQTEKKISQNESKQTINHSAGMKTFTLGNHVVYIFPTPRRRNANIYFDESALFFSLSRFDFSIEDQIMIATYGLL